MGALFSHCAIVLARRKARSRGQRCIAILRETEVHLGAMQQKYTFQLNEVEEAIAVGKQMPTASPHEKQTRKDRLLELLRRRKVLRHYLSVARKRNNQMLAKTMAIEALEVTALQLSAVKSTAEAFEQFSRKTGGVEQLEDASDRIAEHMNTLSDIDDVIRDSSTLPLGFNDDDTDDLLRELAEFEDPDEDNPPAAAAAVLTVAPDELVLPVAPTHAPAGQTDTPTPNTLLAV